MATVGGLQVPPELLQLWQDFFRPHSRQKYGSVAKKGHLLTPKAKLVVAQRSLLPEITLLWQGLSSSERLAWSHAAQQNGQTGWRLFVQDTSYRLKYGLSGIATPNYYHQFKVAHVDIAAPASGVHLVQYHPASYYKRRKVPGTKSQYEEVEVREKLTLPLTVGVSYRTNLTAVAQNAKIEVYATITSSYQGRTIESEARIALPLSSDWARATTIVAEVLGTVRSYNLFVRADGCRGWFEFDNVLCYHSGANYARDARCGDVNNTLTNTNYQIEKSWEEILLPDGAAYDSIYI